MDKRKIVIICVAGGAVALVVAAAIIFGGIFANRPPAYDEPATQPPFSYEEQEPEDYFEYAQPEDYTEPPTEPITAALTVAPTLPILTAPPPAVFAPELVSQGPFDFPMPDVPPDGYFFVIDYYYPAASGTGYRIISYERPADLDFTAIVGKWYLEYNKVHQIASNAEFEALQARQGAQCRIDDRIGLY